VSKSCPTCTFELNDDGHCSYCATTCWFCGQSRDQHEPDCMGGEMERQIRQREDALRAEGRVAALAEVATHLELAAWAFATAAHSLPRGSEKVALAAIAVALRGHVDAVREGTLLSRTKDARVAAPGCEPATLEAMGLAMRAAMSLAKEPT
jgi:hypothetical protein